MVFDTGGLRNVILIGGIIQIIFWIFTILFAVISPIELEGSDWTNFWLVILLLGIPSLLMFVFAVIVKVTGNDSPSLRGYVIVFMSFSIVFILGSLGYLFWRVVVLTRCYDNDTCTSTRTIYIVGASIAGFMLLWTIAIFAVTVALLIQLSFNMLERIRKGSLSSSAYRIRDRLPRKSKNKKTDTSEDGFRIGSSSISSSDNITKRRRSEGSRRSDTVV